ncbi:MAG: HNH endonuclease [Euryarchaeota archaeon]|nr:HNH endonuclease [Euryarchaeota archaeon]
MAGAADPSDRSQSDEQTTTDRDEIPPAQRKKALERDNYTCQLCSAKGAKVGGTIPLQVHHKAYHPDDCEIHDLENLITLCLHCHNWFHNRPSPDTPAVDISDAAADKLIPVDFEIIQILSQDGPLLPSEITDRITPDQSLLAVKERLWRIMGIDNAVEDQPQLLDQDAETGKWGLPYQIDTSERRIPDQVQEIVQRTVDALVESALARGCDRATVTEVFDIHQRTTYKVQYRGQAYDFPVSMYAGKGRPEKDGDEIKQETPPESNIETQQHLDDLGEEEDTESSVSTADGGTEDYVQPSNGDQTPTDPEGSDLSEEISMDSEWQPHPDGSTRDYLISAEKFPEDIQPLIHRLNIRRISKLERGTNSEF